MTFVVVGEKETLALLVVGTTAELQLIGFSGDVSTFPDFVAELGDLIGCASVTSSSDWVKSISSRGGRPRSGDLAVCVSFVLDLQLASSSLSVAEVWLLDPFISETALSEGVPDEINSISGVVCLGQTCHMYAK